jgi:hypothetical protein
MDVRLLRVARMALAGAALALAACTPHIGDKCTLNTDCSISNTRQCDNSQPNGYCTVFNCSPNLCPDNAACIEFQANVPGCPYDDYASPSRSGRSFCMQTCGSDSDCRQSDGYACLAPGQLSVGGVSAIILDSNASVHVCAIPPDMASKAAGAGAVAACPGQDAGPLPEAGNYESGAPQVDAGKAGNDAAADAPSDATLPSGDAGAEGGADATTDASDGSADANGDAGDATSSDAADAGADAPG